MKYLKREKTGSFAFVVIGDGPYKCELEKLVSELELCDKVFFTGMIRPEEMPLYYKLGDLFVSASTSETQGLTYIEALCAGLPLLCKKDDCLNEVLVEGVNGFAFDNEDEFYEKLSNFVDKENINKFKQNALICSDKFSAEMFAQNAEKTYINAIASKKVK